MMYKMYFHSARFVFSTISSSFLFMIISTILNPFFLFHSFFLYSAMTFSYNSLLFSLNKIASTHRCVLIQNSIAAEISPATTNCSINLSSSVSSSNSSTSSSFTSSTTSFTSSSFFSSSSSSSPM